jgi:glycogen debranching enzyme
MTVRTTAKSARNARGIPRQPWLHDVRVSVNGNVTALSSPSGDMGAMAGGRWAAAGAQGVYVDDRRSVSVFALSVGGESPVPVADASSGGRSDFFCSARQLGNPGADPTVEVRRSRTVTVQGIIEVVDVVSRADAPVETDLALHLGGDGAPISSVKSGLVSEALLTGTLLTPTLLTTPLAATPLVATPLTGTPPAAGISGVSWSDRWHRTEVTFDPAPASLNPGGPGEASVATFHLVVAPGQTCSVVTTVYASRLQETNFDADSGSAQVDWSTVSVQSVDRRLSPTLTAGLNDLQHLLLTDPEEPSSVFAAAGTPWYLTLFGRDSLWAARMALPFGTKLAAGTLRALARRQGSVLDSDRAEAPGKIPHELRRTTFTDRSAGLDLPPVYYGTIDATPLWISLLRDAWKWGLADDQVEALLPNLQSATRWLTECAAPDPDGLLKYLDSSGKGLANQGWKDSGDAIRWRDGHVADAPIALCEAQAYAIEAATGAAELFEHFNVDGSAALKDYAGQLRARFRDRFWVGAPGERYLGLAVDGHGQTVDGLGSNMGHVLGTRTLNTEEVDQVAQTLTSPVLLSRYGISTLAHDNGGFNPIGYHTGSIWTHDTAICAWGLAREGKRDEATKVAQSLLASAEAFDYRWPELYGGAGAGVQDRPVPYPASCRPQAWSAASAAVLISVALGFEPDAPAGRLILRPARPAAYGQMTVRGLRFAGRSFGVACAPDGTTELLDAPDDVEIVIL